MRRAVLGLAVLLFATSVEVRAAEPEHTVVYFPSWSAFIGKSARLAIAKVAAAAKAHPGGPGHIELTGYASTVGSVQANTLLAQLRAQVVLDELVADGVPADHVMLRSVGATNFVLDPLESRRVEITLGEN
jgi:cytochrome c oxidase subunit II